MGKAFQLHLRFVRTIAVAGRPLRWRIGVEMTPHSNCMLGLEVKTVAVRCRPGGPDATALRISRPSLKHLPFQPHADAIEWHSSRWNSNLGTH
jgi:hypothetical protein